MYVELHSRSAFSFLEGASLPEALAGVCAEIGVPAMALLDRDGVYGAPRFHLAAKKLGIKAHIGAEVTVRAIGHSAFSTQRSARSSQLAIRNSQNRKSQITNHKFHDSQLATRNSELFRLPLLVASRAGYQNLCRLITRAKLRAPKYPLDSRPETIAASTLDELTEFAGGLICLTGADDGPLAQALMRGGIEVGRL